MGVFFGTDGLRGKVNVDLTFDVAYKCGNALATLKNRPTILIGCDTRTTCSFLTCAFSAGATNGGANVVDLGIVPTSGVAYLTRKLAVDFGVVVSASHNSKEYNGIKIFDKNGYKLGEKKETELERNFIQNKVCTFEKIGKYSQRHRLVKDYQDFLQNTTNCTLSGLFVLLDCSNGASSRISPKIFKNLGAKVKAFNTHCNGLDINENCGALHPEKLAKKVVDLGADMGFAFDGDADRLIAVDHQGNVIDGDMVVLGIAKHWKYKGMLKGDKVVGTSHTNMGIEKQLNNFGIGLVRADIGDKYVLEKMLTQNLVIGGEQSGHVILKDFHTTGDGILTALILANIVKTTHTTLNDVCFAKPFPQTNVNVEVGDKFKVMNNENLAHEISKWSNFLGENGRLLIRASGTEPKIRVMVESNSQNQNQQIANCIVKLIEKIR